MQSYGSVVMLAESRPLWVCSSLSPLGERTRLLHSLRKLWQLSADAIKVKSGICSLEGVVKSKHCCGELGVQRGGVIRVTEALSSLTGVQ